jgi:hypothetical protein
MSLLGTTRTFAKPRLKVCLRANTVEKLRLQAKPDPDSLV